MDQQRIDADYEKLYGRGINDVRQGMVFEKYKAIYFPIPKVACSSIKVFLTDFAEFSLDDLDKFKNYFKFAFVRNPWDRLVSCYINKVAEPQPPFSILA